MNFDVAVREEKACITTVIKYHKAEFLVAWTIFTEVIDPLTVMPKDALLLLTKVKELRYQFVICKGDALNVILSVQSSTN